MSIQLESLKHTVRNHLHFIIIVPVLIIVMTWPAIVHVFDTSTFAVPTRNTDVWQKLWDVWHAKQFLAGRTDFYYSDTMFFPTGVSLVYQNFSLPHMVAVNVLNALLPIATAYNLTYLLIVFAATLSAYIYLNYLFGDKWLALLGAAIFGLSQHVVSHVAHPDVNLIVSLPLSAYFFQRGIQEHRWQHILLCAIIVGFTAFMSIYIFVCVLITMALIVLYFAIDRWREACYWRAIVVLCLIIGAVSAGRIVPIVGDSQDLDVALSKNNGQERGMDLLSYFVNHSHPVTTPVLKSLFQVNASTWWPHTSYLGYLPLLLITIGFFKSTCRRKMLPWLMLALPFLLLRLGSVLHIDGQDYTNIVLPKALLDDLFPAAFRPFDAADHFQMGILLPLAVLTCYGLKAIPRTANARNRAFVALVAVVLIAFEYYGASASRVVPDEQLKFVEWLQTEQNQQETRIINLPMGRQPSKLYGFYQTLTGYPQVEGLTGRTPPAAYYYIESNSLLSAWRSGNTVLCFPPKQEEFISNLDQLLATGFSHIIWHHWLDTHTEIAYSFIDVPPSYSDDYVTIYRTEDLRESCNSRALPNLEALERLRRLAQSAAIIPDNGLAILSLQAMLHPENSPGSEYSAVLLGPYFYAPLVWDQESGKPALPDGERILDMDAAFSAYSLILVVYDPQQIDLALKDNYYSWIARDFRSCRLMNQTDTSVVEYFVSADYPCELAVSVDPLAVDYDNGIQLGNILHHLDDGVLNLYFLWENFPSESHAFSIQLFDADGAKALGQDYVISDKPLAHQNIDLSALPPGDYIAKLIVYNYDTGTSVPGTVTSSGVRFDRALEIARFQVE